MENLTDLYENYSAEQYEFYMIMSKEFNDRELHETI